MTEKIKADVVCENCGHKFEMDIYTTINTRLNPELEEKVTEFEIFEVKCPKCGQDNKVIYDTIYHMDEFGTMIFLIDPAAREERIEEIEEIYGGEDYKNFLKLSGLPMPKIRVVYDPFSLREKIKLFRNGYDDRLFEIFKFFIVGQVAEKMKWKDIDYFYYENVEGQEAIAVKRKRHGVEYLEIDRKMVSDMESEFKEQLEEYGEVYEVDRNFVENFLISLVEKNSRS